MEVEEAIRLRRSVRVYTDRAVEPEAVQKILESAILAPNGGNAQPWDFVLVDGAGKRKEMADLLNEAHNLYFRQAKREKSDKIKEGDVIYDTFYRVPAFIVACLNQKGHRMDDDYAEPEYFWDTQSVCAAFENIILVARSLGLATCWMGVGSLVEPKLKRILAIPDGVKVVAVTPLGYPLKFPPAQPRRPLESVVHRDGWGGKYVPPASCK